MKMKKLSVFMVITAIGMIVASCGNGYNANVKLNSDIDSFLYAFGIANGMGFREQLKTLPGVQDRENYEILVTGFAIAVNDQTSKLKMTQEEAQAYIQTYLTEASTREFEAARAEGEAFLAANKSKAGVITTESGLQYKVLTEGTGKKPAIDDQVIVHYTGKFLDGTVFDSSVQQGEPATFGVTQVIRGWSEALLLMPVGSKYQIWVPSDLAYGEQPYGPIKPNSTLEFEVELLGIAEK